MTEQPITKNTKELPSADRVRELFDYEPSTGVLSRRTGMYQRKTRAVQKIPNPARYISTRADGVFYQVHRLIWLHAMGEAPRGHIDHINGDRTDNRLTNLRDVSQSVNMQNQRRAPSNSKTGLLGAYPHGKKFAAQIGLNGCLHHLGRYATAAEAHAAYLTAKRAIHEGCTI